ncbi:MAG TPA: hypothetical protein VJJ82_01555 [Candidatus Nanoarchaeia archaeon]|nr:hypothetical protein [Candidatus Nanoarchaeia archaeon]
MTGIKKEQEPQEVIVSMRKLGRNEPRHCGSHKKYKVCCMESDIKSTGGHMKFAASFTIFLDVMRNYDKIEPAADTLAEKMF